MDDGSENKPEIKWPLDDFATLDRMKNDDTLKDFACCQVESTHILSACQKADLIHFFLSAMVYDPKMRTTTLENLIKLLGHSWYVHISLQACSSLMNL